MGSNLHETRLESKAKLPYGLIRAITLESRDFNGREKRAWKEGRDAEWIERTNLSWNRLDSDANRMLRLQAKVVKISAYEITKFTA